jgi:hypothetical protein
MGWGSDVHPGVVQHQILEVDELAREPQTGAGIGEVRPRCPTLLDGAVDEPLVEPGEGIFGDRERVGDLRPGQRIRDIVANRQVLD